MLFCEWFPLVVEVMPLLQLSKATGQEPRVLCRRLFLQACAEALDEQNQILLEAVSPMTFVHC